MKEVSIYTMTSIHCPGRRDGKIAFVIEMITAKGPATYSRVAPVQQMTSQQAELTAINRALERLTQPCRIKLFTDFGAMESALDGRLMKWQKDNWKTARGTEVANQAEWKQLIMLLAGSEICVKSNEPHSYRKWMAGEIK